ncbi:MAG: peptide chain release factor N(5)-glutamine methyltransferase [Chloroflexia bacterium]
MTIAEALQRGTALLQESGSPSARLDAEVLLAHVLGLRRVDLYARPMQALTPVEEAAFQSLLRRRAEQEPVSYLVGKKEFFGLTLLLDRRVMIPRPETEVLVERALACARALERDPLLIADIGTGSGCIVVALAHALPRARFYATDISPEAGEVARENFRRHGLEERVIFLEGDLCAVLPERVDLLVSNPPYTVWERLPAGITAYEPRPALDGGPDGLSVYRRLLPQIPEYVRPGGFALLELGDGQAEAVSALAREACPGCPQRTWPDYAGIERVLEIQVLTA